ncbi:hypothetical protein LR48_Vigan06g089100 [Vigna angularis]|uniref:Uncharacterized protein n=1 Tax=Phaseolus angularis TaxID=3914 RepID=A0A0L9URT7_PHAAN|nr:hypothetical protein LR48_Vigan06g089100 [Vigna angularis]
MQESISTQKSIEASCKRMEMQIGHLIERLEDFGNETKVNPREECQAIIIGSEKTLEEKEIERKEKEELSEKDKDVEKEREVVEREERKKICVKITKVRGEREEKKKVREKKICVKIKKVREKKKRTSKKKKESSEKSLPHSKKYHRKEKEFERFMKIFKKFEIKVPMIEIGMASSSGKRMKTLGSKRKDKVCGNTMNNKAPLGHPSLITRLCELAVVNISTPPFERPRKAIDEAYYKQYCGGDEAAQPIPPRHSHRGRGPPQGQALVEPHEAEPFKMTLLDVRGRGPDVYNITDVRPPPPQRTFKGLTGKLKR